jgi:hypothetical protein
LFPQNNKKFAGLNRANKAFAWIRTQAITVNLAIKQPSLVLKGPSHKDLKYFIRTKLKIIRIEAGVYFHARIDHMIGPELLIDKMSRIGIRFLADEGNSESTDSLSSTELLAGLAAQTDARLRLALIAVLLQRSDLAQDAHQALAQMDERTTLTFKLYYTAAHYLQKVYANELKDVLGTYELLPDYYSKELKIERCNSVIEQLKQLAERQKEITGLPLNWYGTYNYAAQRVIIRLKRERSWTTA